MPSFPPHYCAVCGRSFSNQYFHTRCGGDLVVFSQISTTHLRVRAMFLGSLEWRGSVTSIWLRARERVGLPTDTAVSELQLQFCVCPKEPIHGRPNPELVLTAVGPNRKGFRHRTSSNRCIAEGCSRYAGSSTSEDCRWVADVLRNLEKPVVRKVVPPSRYAGIDCGIAGEQSVALDRAGITVFRDITFLAAGPQVNAVVRYAYWNSE